MIEDKLNLLELSKKVTTLLVHELRINTFATLYIDLITISNDTYIFYPSELLRHERQGRPRDKTIYRNLKIQDYAQWFLLMNI